MRARLLAIIVSLVLALSGCQKTPDLECVAESLNQSVKEGDSAKLLDALSGRRAPLVAKNLGRLAEATFEPYKDGLRVKWRAAAIDAPAWHEIGIKAQGCRVVDVFPKEDSPAPIWLSQQIEVYSDDDVTVMAAPRDASGNRVDNSSWLLAAHDAVETVRAAVPELSWDSRLVIQVADSIESFHKITGGAALDGSAAYTLAQDFADANGQAASHIIVNTIHKVDPRFLLTHEAVHVATAELGVPDDKNMWVSEGYAEAIALTANPEHAQESERLIEENGLRPEQPPTAEEFMSKDPKISSLAYARAAKLVGEAVSKGNVLVQLQNLGWPR